MPLIRRMEYLLRSQIAVAFAGACVARLEVKEVAANSYVKIRFDVKEHAQYFYDMLNSLRVFLLSDAVFCAVQFELLNQIYIRKITRGWPSIRLPTPLPLLPLP